MPLPRRRKVVPDWVPGGQVVLHLAVDGGDLQLRAQGRLGEGDGLPHTAPMVPSRLEQGVGPDGDADEQVAGGAAVLAGVALAPEGDGLAVVDAGGDGDLDRPAACGRCRCRRQSLQGWWMILPVPPQREQGAVVAKTHMARLPPLDADHAGAAAVGADLRGGAGRAAGAVAGRRSSRCGSASISFSQPKAASSKVMVRLARRLSPRWGALGLACWPPPKPPPKKPPKKEPNRSPRSKSPRSPSRRSRRRRRSWGPRRRGRTGRTWPASPCRRGPRRPR